jgi:hypothetical protein
MGIQEKYALEFGCTLSAERISTFDIHRMSLWCKSVSTVGRWLKLIS